MCGMVVDESVANVDERVVVVVEIHHTERSHGSS